MSGLSEALLYAGAGGLVAIAVGISFVRASGTLGRARQAFAARAASAPGEVLENVWRSHWTGGGDSSSLAYPLLRYRLPDGTVMEQESFDGASPPVARKGRAVTVLYDPADPRRVRIAADGAAHKVIPVLMVMFGIAFAIMGAIIVAGAIAGLLLL